ncbi:MAG TPA: histone H1-like repetitive region-containing protein [Candidatus Nanopelagicaceae bacterium]
MAVKKATAKKSVAKRPAAKKPTSKKATVRKKTATKKSVTKKSVAKKSPAKKAAAKKSAVKKSTSKKSAAKKAPAKHVARPIDKFVVPPVPVSSLSRPARVEVSTVPAPVHVPAPPLLPSPVKKQGASGRVVFAVVVGIFILGLIVWARAHNPNTDGVATPSATPTATESTTPTPTPTPSATPTVVITVHSAPQGVVAHYTTPGATIFWSAPAAVEGLTGYNIEISISSGPWKLISTVPATQTSLDVVKANSTGWTSFRVSSVYADSQITSAKAFGLPGTYS